MLTENLSHREFLAVLTAERVVAILRATDADHAVATGRDLIDAGIRVLEVSLNTPGALEAIAELSAYAARHAGVMIGAGTVLNQDAVAQVSAAGATFFVAPVFDQQAVIAANELGVAAVPGCATPTEMLNAHNAGAVAVKIFPATLWSPDGLANVLRAMPFLQVIPTGGIRIDHARSWLDAGSLALGIGSTLTQAPDSVTRLKEAVSPFTGKVTS